MRRTRSRTQKQRASEQSPQGQEATRRASCALRIRITRRLDCAAPSVAEFGDDEESALSNRTRKLSRVVVTVH